MPNNAASKSYAPILTRESGLRIQGRDGLKQLIEDIQSGRADYEAVIGYDISRWGRFQDADESAYYEYICKRAGISVIYCAEQFENDGSPVSTIVKGVKRAMAGEYSRELYQKVFTGQCHLIELGYRQGGPPGFGLRRMLIDEREAEKGTLQRGEHKSIQTDRVTLVPGLAIIQEIFHGFVEDRKFEAEIAEALNARGIVTDLGRAWTRGTVHQILINEKYMPDRIAALLADGTIGRNRITLRLQAKALGESLGLQPDAIDPAVVTIDAPFALRRRGVEGKIIVVDREPQSDRTMLRALAQAHAWVANLRKGRPLGDIAASTGHSESYIRTRAQLAYLAPAIQGAILDGRQPADLTLERIIRKPVPLDWDIQARLYGFGAAPGIPVLRAAFTVPAKNVPDNFGNVPCYLA
jgi:DNA invertase Pin-like site-specific DNA recombinase